MSGEVLPGIASRQVEGYLDSYLLRRDLQEEVECATIMLFESMGSVRTFAGEDYESAYVPPPAREVLARFHERSAHYTVLLTPNQTRRIVNERIPPLSPRWVDHR